MNGEVMGFSGTISWGYHGDIMGEISKTSTQGGMDHRQCKLGENYG